MSVRATCTRCHEAIVTAGALPLAEHDMEALAAHVRLCGCIPAAERPPQDGSLGDLLRYFEIDVRLD